MARAERRPNEAPTTERRPSSARRLRRDEYGHLYDVIERRRVTFAELCDDLRARRSFRAYRHDTGEDCTFEVLLEALAVGLLPNAQAFARGGLAPLNLPSVDHPWDDTRNERWRQRRRPPRYRIDDDDGP